MKTRTTADGRKIAVHDNNGLRKVCGCPRRKWVRCGHAWHFSFKHGETHWRFSLDRVLHTRVRAKADAEAAAEDLRVRIRAGKFSLQPAAVPAAPRADVVTFDRLCDIWREREHRPTRDRSYTRSLAAAPAATGGRLGDKAIGTITEDDFETAFDALRGRDLAVSTLNHHVQTVKAIQKWARRKGYLERPWLSEDAAIKRAKPAQRHRRLVPGEEASLLAAASPWLQRIIIAALETGCRKGELLSLQWADVSLSRGEIVIRAEKAKTRTRRVIAVSPRLKAVLLMLRLDPAGQEQVPMAYVFGDAVGGQIGSFATAWETAVLKAHGQAVRRHPRTHALLPESRARFAEVDLHFHDLRHEAGSRMVEAGWPLHHVQAMLGHANLSQTSTYLNAQATGLQDSMRRFGTAPLQTVASDAAGELGPLCNTIAEEPAKSLVN